jgi:hypothetical protein
MAKTKTSFPRSIPALLDLSRGVKTSIINNPHFANISAEFAAIVAQLGAATEKLQNAYDEAKLGGTQRTAYREAARAELVALLQKVIKHLELFADGDVNILKRSGFEVLEPAVKKTRIPSVLEALQVNVKHGPDGGTFVAKGKPFSYALSYEAHVAKGDPTVPENWGHYGFFPHCTHMELKGFTAGDQISLRFRAITPQGEAPWSATHTIMSL